MFDREERIASTSTSQIVFLLGAGRSGTTLLYKTIGLHPDVNYLNTFDKYLPPWIPLNGFSRLIAPFPMFKAFTWFSEGNASSRRPLFKRVVPRPAEGERVYKDCGFPITPTADYQPSGQTVLCLRKRFRHFSESAGAKVFISKRTANNRRLPWLREIFPQALFIHLIRDGRAVAYSLTKMKSWHNSTVWWTGRSVKEHITAGDSLLELCARNWVEEVQAVREGLSGLPSSRVLELRYESLLSNPGEEISRVLAFLGLSSTPRFEAALRHIGITDGRPQQWRTFWSNSELHIVTEKQHALLSEFGYLQK